MIRPLRQRHRQIVIALGAILPVAFTVGISVRNPVPKVATLPAGLVASPRAFAATIWERSDLFAKTAIRVRLVRENAISGRFALELSAPGTFAKPDLIVYWIGGSSKITETLPENAVLLGAFNSMPLVLPGNASTESGMLSLYSLANNEIVDVSKPLRFSNSNN